MIFFQEQTCSKFNYEYDSIFHKVENHKLSVIYNYEM